MENVAYMGLKTEKIEMLTDRLNELLANYQVFFMNVRGFHWNITGERFFELHKKFEKLYTDSLEKTDEIAERIKTLGYTPVHSYTDYVNLSEVRERRNVGDARKCIQAVLDGLRVIIDLEREILSISQDVNDEGTNNLMSDFIKEHEKQVWMYNAFMGEQ